MNSYAIEFDNISLSFNGKEIFRDFNMSVKKGANIAIKGPSGRGKTTLMKIIMGFVTPSQGEASVFGEKISGSTIDNIRKKIYWLPQNYSIIGHGTTKQVFDNIFSLKNNTHIDPGEDEILELMNRIGLGKEHYNKKFENLSGGEQQRTGLILGKLLKRDIMLLDEPTSALDNDSIQKAADILFRGDATIFSASHDDNWLTNCDEVIEV